MTSVKKRITQDAERVNPVAPVHIWRSPAGAADMLIVTHLDVYLAMHTHATEALPNETGGFLIGRVAHDHHDGCWHLEIEQALPVEPESQDPVHFTFTWRDVDRVRSYRENEGKALIGWYHTHPDIDIFLSETDLERTHRVLFSEPFQVALVYDPVRGRAGYFFWDGAQSIDATRAAWREFDIAVGLSPETASAAAAGRLTTAPAQSQVFSSSSSAVGDGACVSLTDTAAAPQPPPDQEPQQHEQAEKSADDAMPTPPATPPTARRLTSPDEGTTANSTETHHRRLRVTEDADDLRMRAPTRSVARTLPTREASAGNLLTERSAGGTIMPALAITGVPRALWTVLGSIFLVIVGLAVGYFWFGPGRG
jgi:proteasome lid subunit RPN8/RPN11